MIRLFLKLLPLGILGFFFQGQLSTIANQVQHFSHFPEMMLAKSEMQLYSAEIGGYIFRYKRAPRRLAQFLDEKFRTEESKRENYAEDFWGNEYAVDRDPEGWWIGCAGPDAEWDTDDDMWLPIKVQDRFLQ